MGPQDLLDALDEIGYVSDPNTYELLYANRRCRSLLPTRAYKFGNSTTLPWDGIFF